MKTLFTNAVFTFVLFHAHDARRRAFLLAGSLADLTFRRAGDYRREVVFTCPGGAETFRAYGLTLERTADNYWQVCNGLTAFTKPSSLYACKRACVNIIRHFASDGTVLHPEIE